VGSPGSRKLGRMEGSIDRSRLWTAGLLAAPLGVMLVVIALTPGPAYVGITSDLRVYFDYSARLLGGAVPYRDFPLEYPPLALIPMTLPRLVSPFGTLSDQVLIVLFAVIEGCLAIAVGWLIGRISPDRVPAIATWAALVLLAGGSIAWRYDLWPAATVLIAFAAVGWGRPGLAGVALGVGTMLKLFPLVVLPILAARSIALRDWVGLARLVGGAATVVGIVMGVSFVAAGSDSLHWLTYEIDRGLQLESTGSGVLLLLHVVAGQPYALEHAFGTLQVIAPGADAIVAATPFAELALLAVVAFVALFRFRRDAANDGRVPTTTMAMAIVAVLVALIVSSKVFSAQYVVWFLPLVPFLPGRLRWLGLVIAGLSTFIYPLNYAALWQLDPLMAVILNIRNALLIGFLAWLLVRLAKPANAAGREPVT
jgi:glycosyl transferase family 87